MSYTIPPSAHELLRDLAGMLASLDESEAAACRAARRGASIVRTDLAIGRLQQTEHAIVAMARLLVQATGHAEMLDKRNALLTMTCDYH